VIVDIGDSTGRIDFYRGIAAALATFRETFDNTLHSDRRA
jgi:hypothetical protein